MSTLPTLFVSHGAPTFAIEPGLAGRQLGALGTALGKPKAIVVARLGERAEHRVLARQLGTRNAVEARFAQMAFAAGRGTWSPGLQMDASQSNTC